MGGSLSFDPLINGQRPALLLSNDAGGKHVVISWASHCDFGQYHGWLISYNAGTLAREAAFNVSPNGVLGGIWMSGNGPAADASGNIFFSTGNGSWTGTDAFGDSIVKLGPQSGTTFTNLDYFTPTNQSALNSVDEDLGSGGLLLLPDLSGPHPHLLVQVGKEGKIYVTDRGNLGHILCTNNCSSTDTQIVQELPAGTIGGMWSSPAYWNGNLYFGGNGDTLKAFSISASAATPIPIIRPLKAQTGLLSLGRRRPFLRTEMRTASSGHSITANTAPRSLPDVTLRSSMPTTRRISPPSSGTARRSLPIQRAMPLNSRCQPLRTARST